jgi:TRAP-type C4-dicarboxylate transport system permease small subunit
MYDKFEERIAVFLFLFIFILMSTQIFTRYLINFTFAWNIELCRYTFVWLTFIGAAYVRKQNAHIKIEILFNYLNQKLSPGVQKAVWLTKEILTFAYLVGLIYFGFILAYKSRRFMSQAMQISQFYLYISASVGGLLYLIREIQASYRYYQENFPHKRAKKAIT